MKKESAILITGAGSGIGKAIAQTLSQKNPNTPLILTGRNLKKLNETLSTLSSQNLHQTYSLDITEKASIKNLNEHLVKNQISLNGLILNAGIGGENEYGDHDRWDEIIATNLTGPYTLVQELLPIMRIDNSYFKSIVFISSILARLGVPKYNAYCATKAGLLGLMRSLAAELANDKILVNAICPGWVDTEMSTQGIKEIAMGSGKTIEETKNEQMASVPLRKMSSPNEVAELVYFLMSGVQTSITGQTLDINNGAMMA